MNEQIEELAKEAGFDVYQWNENELEKFAKLIIEHERERCVDIVYYGNEDNLTVQSIISKIREDDE